LLSNQDNFGKHDLSLGVIGSAADKSYFTSGFDSARSKIKDIVLLPHIKAAIEDKTHPKVIFIHLLGSHYDFCSKTDGKYEHFVSNKQTSCYIQSIKQTDELLAQIHQYLQQTNQDWAMVYFSDHGLSFVKPDWIGVKFTRNNLWHGDRKINFEVPFIVMDSTMTETKFIKQRRSALHFFDFFGQWLGVKDKLLPNKCNFVSEEECPNPNDVITSNNKISDYSQLKNEKYNFLKPTK